MCFTEQEKQNLIWYLIYVNSYPEILEKFKFGGGGVSGLFIKEHCRQIQFPSNFLAIQYFRKDCMLSSQWHCETTLECAQKPNELITFLCCSLALTGKDSFLLEFFVSSGLI